MEYQESPTKTYFNGIGRFQDEYDYYYEKLVPSTGEAETPSGNLLIKMSKIYYRCFNDGDSYDELVKNMGKFYDISTIKGIDRNFLLDLKQTLYLPDYDKFADKAIRYVILQDDHETWNPLTNKLIRIGEFQNTYDYFYNKLIIATPPTEWTPFAHLLNLASKIIVRKYKYGDKYQNLVEDGGKSYSLMSIDNIEKGFLKSLETILNVDKDTIKFINKILIHIMLEHSTPETIWNPNTNRLVSIYGTTGIKCLKMLDCRITYTPN